MNNRYRNYQPRYTPRPHRNKQSSKSFLLVLVVLVSVIGWAAWGKLRHTDTEEVKTSAIPKKAPVQAEVISATAWDTLSQKINALINQNQGLDISVSVIEVTTNTQANYGLQEAFHGASTTKVLTAAAYLHDVEQGKRSLTENLGGGSAETHLRRMINRSDNTSWDTLNSAVGHSRLDTYADEIGVKSYKYMGNLMTASDQAILLKKLYKREILNESHTKLLLSFMQNTNNEDMIPQVTPGGTLYHKYGQLDDRLHDSAIVNYKDRPVVVVIYTKGTEDGNVYSTRIALIQELAQAIFSVLYRE